MPVPLPPEERRRALHRVLPVGGVLVFSPAALLVFDREVAVGGVPLLLLYMLLAWLVGIALTGWLAAPERRGGDPSPRAGGEEAAEGGPRGDG